MKINYRKFTQWGIILIVTYFLVRSLVEKNYLVDFEAYCPFGGIQALLSFIYQGTLACSMTGTQVVMGVVLLVGVLLFSKLFCSHLCPLGTVAEWLGGIGAKYKVRFEIKGIADKILRSLKYILLFVTLYFTTTSSELFCKNYDPFFATVTLFGVDVSPWMAGITIFILIAGSIFTRLFWCKYLCPLGAISNLFNFIYLTLILILVFVGLYLTGMRINIAYAYAFVCLSGYIYEIVRLRKNQNLQMLKVKRDIHTCIDCGLCSRKCPQGIDVAGMKVVRHVDCNLCGDCVSACPVNGALKLNNKRKLHWMPVVITTVLVVLGLVFSKQVRIPTIDQKWGDEAALKKAEVFEMDNLKNIKCYGSSMSFANQMKSIDGILGVSTYVGDHSVKVLFDPEKLNAKKIKQHIFTPVKIFVSDIKDNQDTLISYTLKIDKFFDQIDVLILQTKFKNHGGIFNFHTQFGEPVLARLYCNDSISPESIQRLIEAEKTIYPVDGIEQVLRSKFKVAEIVRDSTKITGLELKREMFLSFKQSFNNRNNYSNDQLEYCDFIMKEYPRNQQMMPYLINYLGKTDSGIVGLVSFYAVDFPIARVFFVKEKTNEENIAQLMTSKTIHVVYSNGSVEDMDNPYLFGLPKNESK